MEQSSDSDGRISKLATWAQVLLLVATTAAMTMLVRAQPLMADDYANLALVKTLRGPFEYVGWEYLHWTGRAPGLVALWVGLRYHDVYSLAVALGFLTVAGLCVSVAFGRMPWKVPYGLPLTCFAYVALWFGCPSISQLVSWVTGSAAYLWSAVALLAFAYPYRRFQLTPASLKESRVRPLWALWLLVLGLVAGSIHEQTLVILIALLAAGFAWSWRAGRIREVPYPLWVGVAGLLLGGVISVAAPGNAARSASLPTTSIAGKAVAFVSFVAKSGGVWLSALYPYLLVIALVAIPVAALVAGRVGWRRKDLAPALAFAVAGALSILVFVVQPIVGMLAGARTAILPAVILVVALLALLAQAEDPLLHRLPKAATGAIVSLLLVAVLIDVVGGIQLASLIQGDLAARRSAIASQVAAGQKDVTVPPLAHSGTRVVFFGDITADPAFWNNKGVAEYYGVKSIRLKVDGAPGPQDGGNPGPTP